jgi:hypothetical protein
MNSASGSIPDVDLVFCLMFYYHMVKEYNNTTEELQLSVFVTFFDESQKLWVDLNIDVSLQVGIGCQFLCFFPSLILTLEQIIQEHQIGSAATVTGNENIHPNMKRVVDHFARTTECTFELLTIRNIT